MTNTEKIQLINDLYNDIRKIKKNPKMSDLQKRIEIMAILTFISKQDIDVKKELFSWN